MASPSLTRHSTKVNDGCLTQNLPLAFDAGDANFYRYVGNNPTNLTDPSGLQSVQPNPDDRFADSVQGRYEKRLKDNGWGDLYKEEKARPADAQPTRFLVALATTRKTDKEGTFDTRVEFHLLGKLSGMDRGAVIQLVETNVTTYYQTKEGKIIKGGYSFEMYEVFEFGRSTWYGPTDSFALELPKGQKDEKGNELIAYLMQTHAEAVYFDGLTKLGIVAVQLRRMPKEGVPNPALAMEGALGVSGAFPLTHPPVEYAFRFPPVDAGNALLPHAGPKGFAVPKNSRTEAIYNRIETLFPDHTPPLIRDFEATWTKGQEPKLVMKMQVKRK
jgi:hypothetical protein